MAMPDPVALASSAYVAINGLCRYTPDDLRLAFQAKEAVMALRELAGQAERGRPAPAAPTSEAPKLPDGIHSNPDAQVWAKAFVAHVNWKPSIATDEETMIGWFANAMMAMHDSRPVPAAPVYGVASGSVMDRVTVSDSSAVPAIAVPAAPGGDFPDYSTLIESLHAEAGSLGAGEGHLRWLLNEAATELGRMEKYALAAPPGRAAAPFPDVLDVWGEAKRQAALMVCNGKTAAEWYHLYCQAALTQPTAPAVPASDYQAEQALAAIERVRPDASVPETAGGAAPAIGQVVGKVVYGGRGKPVMHDMDETAGGAAVEGLLERASAYAAMIRERHQRMGSDCLVARQLIEDIAALRAIGWGPR